MLKQITAVLYSNDIFIFIFKGTWQRDFLPLIFPWLYSSKAIDSVCKNFLMCLSARRSPGGGGALREAEKAFIFRKIL